MPRTSESERERAAKAKSKSKAKAAPKEKGVKGVPKEKGAAKASAKSKSVKAEEEVAAPAEEPTGSSPMKRPAAASTGSAVKRPARRSAGWDCVGVGSTWLYLKPRGDRDCGERRPHHEPLLLPEGEQVWRQDQQIREGEGLPNKFALFRCLGYRQ